MSAAACLVREVIGEGHSHRHRHKLGHDAAQELENVLAQTGELLLVVAAGRLVLVTAAAMALVRQRLEADVAVRLLGVLVAEDRVSEGQRWVVAILKKKSITNYITNYFCAK